MPGNKRARSGGSADPTKGILGNHPSPPHPFGEVLTGSNATTKSGVPHRALAEAAGRRAKTVEALRTMLVSHHTSPESLRRTEEQRQAVEHLGLGNEQARLRRFPTNPSTQKGNLAEIVLAEYVVAARGGVVPVYRLRYNPNIDQSMKGDDVLAFDLDSDPVRIIVGEAKYRGTSSAAAVTEIVEGLLRSHKGGVPVSLQFVADRLFEEQREALGERVLACALLFVQGRLQLDYVGMLLSDTNAATRVHDATPADLRRLAMISLSVDDADGLVNGCYDGLE